MAARWTTASAPASADSRSPATTSAARASTPASQAGSRRPSREMAIASWPRSTRCGTRWLPTNPVAPTTATFMRRIVDRLRATVKSHVSAPSLREYVPASLYSFADALPHRSARDGRHPSPARHRSRRSTRSAAAAARSMRRSPPTRCWPSSTATPAASAAMPSRSSGIPAEERLHGFNGSGRSPAGLTIGGRARRRPRSDAAPRAAHDHRARAQSTPGSSSSSDSGAAPSPTRSRPAARTAEEGYVLTAINVRSIAGRAADVRRPARAVFEEVGDAG